MGENAGVHVGDGEGGAALTSLLIKCNGLQRVGKRVRGHRINKWGAAGDTIAS